MPIKNYKKGKRQKSVDPLNRLARKLRQGAFADSNIKLTKSPEGIEKMSDVLEEFVAPYDHLATNLEQMKTLYTVAVIAWNAAIFPQEEGQQTLVDKLAKELADGGKVKTDFREIIQPLIERKNQYFAANQRLIASFELVDTGNGYHLSVASTLPSPPSTNSPE